MSLIFDERASLGDQGGVHAFVVGISSYTRLPPPSQPGDPELFGMRSLTTAAETARQMVDWLIGNECRLPRRLASVRLLLAPSPEEQMRAPQRYATAGEPTLEVFLEEAERWRDDAARNPDGMTLFFFAGHEMQGPSGDEVLVLKDFGIGGGGRLRKTVTTGSLVAGMAPTSEYPSIARRQLYFIDACRDRPDAVKMYQVMKATPAFDVAEALRDDRQAPQYHAAIPGAQARARRGTTTLFGEALLSCLCGSAGAREEDGPGWHVSVGSLAQALKMMERDARRRYRTNDIMFNPGVGGDPTATIVRLPEPPYVEVTLLIEPRDAVDFTEVLVRDARGDYLQVPNPLAPHPYRCRWQAGAYKVEAELRATGRRLDGEYRDVLPPFWRHQVKVDA